MDREARVVLRRTIVPSFRHRSRVHGGSFEAGGSTSQERAAGARCLSRHSRYNRSSHR